MGTDTIPGAVSELLKKPGPPDNNRNPVQQIVPCYVTDFRDPILIHRLPEISDSSNASLGFVVGE